MLDDRVVELVACAAQRGALNDVGEREDRDFGRAAADVDDHRAFRFGHRQPDAQRGQGPRQVVGLVHHFGISYRFVVDRAHRPIGIAANRHVQQPADWHLRIGN